MPDNYAVTYLTNLIYNSIQYAVGSGDLACVSLLICYGNKRRTLMM